jgi:hypothetical protein
MHNAHTSVRILAVLEDMKSLMTFTSTKAQPKSIMPKGLGYPWESDTGNTILLHDALGPPVVLPMMLLRQKWVRL